MKVYPPRYIRSFIMYCVNGKPRSSLLIESTDSMIYISISKELRCNENLRGVGNFKIERVIIIIVPVIFLRVN